MLMKIYALSWVLVAAAAGVVSFTGNFNEVAQVVFGFLISGLLFSAVVAVLPWWVDRFFSPPAVKQDA